jgi:hypothetical protein
MVRKIQNQSPMKKLLPVLTIAIAFAMIFILPKKSKGQEEEKEHKCKHDHSEYVISGIKIKKAGDDSVVIYVNKKEVDDFPGCTNWGAFPFCGKKGKYNGHWAGVDFGWNGYATRDFNMDFPPEEQFLNMNTARSLMVNLNPFELNVNIARNKFGFTSGLGLALHNYYFTNSYTWISDSSRLVAFNTVDEKGVNAGMKVNKLYVAYITLPLIFEYQTNPRHRINSFHVGAGVIGGVRIDSYQKQKLYQWKETYYLVDGKGNKVASFYADDDLIRNRSSYFLSPFKLDATLRVGWSVLNLYSTFSITSMFQKNKGPEVYPWTVGITLVGW